jgi:hemerythrin-like domain-containing protein
MTDVLLLLRLEHKNFDELLNLIDEQRHNLEQGGDVDINLLQSIIEYFSGYPDECHHPVEDIVLQRLCVRDSSAVPDINRLSKEHREIERLTGLLATTLTATVNTGNAQTPELGEVMQQFVSNYRNHMKMEEECFFSTAAKALSKEDWEVIEFDLFDRDDPLFDRAAHARFRGLREEIENSAGE